MFTDKETLIKKNSYNFLNKSKLKNIRITPSGFLNICIKGKTFGGTQAREVLSTLNYTLKKYGNKLTYVYFDFDNFKPADKLSYLILELIIFILYDKYNIKSCLNCNVTASINTYGIYESMLVAEPQNSKSFFQEYLKSIRIKERSFRKIIACDNLVEISVLMTEIKSFLKYFDICDTDRNNIAKMISELADNACEHSNSDCLVDIDISDFHKKTGDEHNDYYAVNICVLNLSDILLGEKVKHKITNKNYHAQDIRYNELYSIYNKHKQFFDKDYTEDHFFMLASFQNDITGRDDETNTGGKGLAEIVCELENTVDQYACYVLSGDNAIAFYPHTLEIDDSGWISFNKEKNFINKPDTDVILHSDTYLPGTGFNLTLIYKRSKIK